MAANHTVAATAPAGQLAAGVHGTRLKNCYTLRSDIFLSDTSRCYLGRICTHRVCHLRATCQARHCGRRQHLRDDLDVVTLDTALIAAPPIDLRPDLVRRCSVPADVEALVLKPLKEDAGLSQMAGGDAPSPRPER